MSAAGLALLFGCAFCLPAPEHLSMQSVNFRHTLSWNPGNGTPPGTSYIIYDASSSRLRKQIKISNKTSAKLKLEDRFPHQLTVVASYNSSQSPESQKLQFIPYIETKIDPPQVLLSGCGACLQVSVALPGVGSGAGVDVHNFYKPHYSVVIRERAEQEANGSPYKTKSRNFTLEHLRSGTEYCIQVHVLTMQNQNTQPSAWTCAFTSTAKPYTGPLIAGLVAGLGIFLVGAVTVLAFCLKYMGFICKLQMALPPVLLGLRRGYTLSPERTVPDRMSISPRVEGHKPNGPAALQPAEEEEEEEEEEGGGNNYMVGNFELSSDESPCSKSADGLQAAAHADQPEGDEEEDEEEEVGHAEGQEDMAEGEEGSEAEEEVEVEEEQQQQQAFSSSGDIDLLSVRLGALVTCEEEEQTLEWTEQEALLSHDQTAVSVRTPVEDQSLPHEEEEEEEEEESSAYLRH